MLYYIVYSIEKDGNTLETQNVISLRGHFLQNITNILSTGPRQCWKKSSRGPEP